MTKHSANNNIGSKMREKNTGNHLFELPIVPYKMKKVNHPVYRLKIKLLNDIARTNSGGNYDLFKKFHIVPAAAAGGTVITGPRSSSSSSCYDT